MHLYQEPKNDLKWYTDKVKLVLNVVFSTFDKEVLFDDYFNKGIFVLHNIKAQII